MKTCQNYKRLLYPEPKHYIINCYFSHLDLDFSKGVHVKQQYVFLFYRSEAVQGGHRDDDWPPTQPLLGHQLGLPDSPQPTCRCSRLVS